MRACTFILLACLAVASRCEPGEHPENKELIMLEIERLDYPSEDKVVKRQAEVQYGAPGQYVVRTSDSGSQQQVPPEYLSLLHQLSPQQNQQPHDIQQLFVTRNPQESYAQNSQQSAPLPPRPRLTPEQEQMRRLQEAAANKHIREQQQRALQRALQTGQFQPGFQPQPYQPEQPPPYQPQQQSYQQLQPSSYQPQQPSYQPQPSSYQPQQPSYQPQQPSYQPQQPSYQPQQPSYQSQPQDYSQPQSEYDSSSSFGSEPEYSQPSSQYYQQTRSIRPAQAPQKFSYSQVHFGSADTAREALEPRLASIQQRLQSQVKSQPEYYRPPPQPQGPPRPSAPQPQVDYNAYNVQQQQQTPTQPQHPEQYLIETTPTRTAQTEEPVVMIPRPRRPPAPAPQSLYFRPEPAESHYAKQPESFSPPARSNYQEARQYPAAPEYVPRPQILPAHDAPSRSAIYVQQSGISKRITTQQPPSYNGYNPYSQGIPRIPTPQGQRPLTATELKALSKAGFQISPLTLNSLQEPSEISPSYDEDSDVYRSSNSKRQSQYIDERKPPGKYPKRIPKPVPLTDTERKLLAEQGIRNLYRVESSESKDAPVTYVLAIDNAVRKRESETTSEEN